MFPKNKQIIKFSHQFLLYSRYRVYLLMKKKFDKSLTHFGDALCKK